MRSARPVTRWGRAPRARPRSPARSSVAWPGAASPRAAVPRTVRSARPDRLGPVVDPRAAGRTDARRRRARTTTDSRGHRVPLLGPLNYHHLLYFWTVAREGSIARATERLHLSQPAISTQIRTLERAIGEKLFAKRG